MAMWWRRPRTCFPICASSIAPARRRSRWRRYRTKAWARRSTTVWRGRRRRAHSPFRALPLSTTLNRRMLRRRPGAGASSGRWPARHREPLMNIAHQSTTIAPDLLARFIALVGQKYAVTDPAEQEKYLVESRNLYRGTSPAILRPGSVAEVAAILRLASETGTPIVPQGGNTGLVGGQIPRGGELVLAL